MDARLLKYYNQELQYIREMGGEFARQFPKIAGRLGLDIFECADPYVERLLEGFAFLAARVHLKMDDEFPQFTQHLLELAYPDYLSPTPSMAIVQFAPDMEEGSLKDGFLVPRGTELRGRAGLELESSCTYRTAHDLTLWPLELAEASYFSREAASIEIPAALRDEVRAGIRLRLRAAPGMDLAEIAVDRLPIYLRGHEELPHRIYEQIFANSLGILARPATPGAAWLNLLPTSCLQPIGFADEEALLPVTARSFQGYRLLREYFAFHERFLFFEIQQLQRCISQCQQAELELVILLDRADSTLENQVKTRNFALHCTPAVNLFDLVADAIHVDRRRSEYHIVADRTRAQDLEIYDITQLTGTGANAAADREFLPLYASPDHFGREEHQAYYTKRRGPRLLPSSKKESGSRTSYSGSEVYVSIVEGESPPYGGDLQLLIPRVTCTNRDLPLLMPIGKSTTDFTVEVACPTRSIRCVSGPSRPKPSFSFAAGELAWRSISHLSLNYLSLVDSQDGKGAKALRELLALYSDLAERGMQKQIEGVNHVASRPIIRGLPIPGPLVMGRGIEVTVTVDEQAFEGSGAFLLGAVLERFFAKYVSINSFTETVLRSLTRSEIMRWPIRLGRRHNL